ncbi:ATP-binding protein [Paraburkholderia aspalathi]|uniref:ATP-binding protein n=1 Tax=Paraburkholderia aspalathi TaxID=1324617 RepID=UPI0038BD9FF5
MATNAGVTIQVEVRASFNGNPLLVQRALGNLLSNALVRALVGSRILMKCESHGDYAELSVTDTGEGIASAHIPRIFDRFYHVGPARHGRTSGTGLGLAIVKSIMKEHGGECSVTSAPHIRTTFSLRFPR